MSKSGGGGGNEDIVGRLERKWPTPQTFRGVGRETTNKPYDNPTAGPAVTRRFTPGGGIVGRGARAPKQAKSGDLNTTRMAPQAFRKRAR